MPPLTMRVGDECFHLIVETLSIRKFRHLAEFRQQTVNVPSLLPSARRVSAPPAINSLCSTGFEIGVLRVRTYIGISLYDRKLLEDGILPQISGRHFWFDVVEAIFLMIVF